MKKLAKVKVVREKRNSLYKIGQVYEVAYIPSKEIYRAENGMYIDPMDIVRK